MKYQSRITITKKDIAHIPEINILQYYLNIDKIPCVILSPLRKENTPSFGLYSTDGNSIFYKDFATGDKGDIIKLLSKIWLTSYKEAIIRIYNEQHLFHLHRPTLKNLRRNIRNSTISTNLTEFKVEIIKREWNKEDAAYWESYGISLEALDYANVFPISHIIFIADSKSTLRNVDKYAYAFKESKEDITTYKIYQPFSKRMKWLSKHDRSVISLWTKIPEKGKNLFICSSLKDALCLRCCTGYPSIALQGEGYTISNSVINSLKSRYENIYILFDNDKAGIECGKSLSKATGFTYLELPKVNNQKDISDIYKSLNNKSELKSIINSLI